MPGNNAVTGIAPLHPRDMSDTCPTFMIARSPVAPCIRTYITINNTYTYVLALQRPQIEGNNGSSVTLSGGGNKGEITGKSAPSILSEGALFLHSQSFPTMETTSSGVSGRHVGLLRDSGFVGSDHDGGVSRSCSGAKLPKARRVSTGQDVATSRVGVAFPLLP